MLRKLLKYDFRANLKIFLFVWPAILLSSLVAHLLLSTDLDSKVLTVLFITIMGVYIFSIVGINFFAFYISARRFYSGLLGKEGYLMFTLPVKPWQLIMSKFIVSFTTISTTLIISATSAVLLFTGIDIFDQMSVSFRSVDLPDGIQSVLGGLTFFASLSSGILQIYLACALGHQFKKRRLLWSVLFYYGINVVMQVFTSLITIVTNSDRMEATKVGTVPSTEVSLLFTLVITVGICLVFFFLTERILRKKLNLE